MKHIKKHWVLYLMTVLVLISWAFNDIEFTVSGGFAWLLIWCQLFIGIGLLYTGITGGEVSYKSNGLIPTVKHIYQHLKEKKQGKENQ
jgi:hypothetical protein